MLRGLVDRAGVALAPVYTSAARRWGATATCLVRRPALRAAHLGAVTPVAVNNTWTCRRACASQPAPNEELATATAARAREDEEEDEDDEEIIDLTASIESSIRRDAGETVAESAREAVIAKLLPPTAPAEAIEALRKYFTERPINGMIRADVVTITHIEGRDGRDERAPAAGYKELSFDDALEKAMDAEMDLVRFGGKFDDQRGIDVAYCRLRFEKVAALRSVAPLLPKELNEMLVKTGIVPESAGDDAADAEEEAKKDFVLEEMTVHQFRDRADAHFVGWKSKKIVQEMRRRHPTRLLIGEFSTPVSAIRKMREMLLAIEQHAKVEDAPVPHFYTGVHANGKELAIILQPQPAKAKQKDGGVRHPSPEDWKRALTKMNDALGIAGDSAAVASGTSAPEQNAKRKGGKKKGRR